MYILAKNAYFDGNAPSLYRMSKFQLNWTKIRSKTGNGRILCLWETKFNYDVMLMSRLAISSSILLSRLDYIYFSCVLIFNTTGLQTKE